MKSPQGKKRPWQSERVFIHEERKHLNKRFYNSKAWKDMRQSYLNNLRNKIATEIPKGYWTLRNGDTLNANQPQQSYLLSLDYIPCETCIKLYISGAYEYVTEAKELDHIIGLNPENAIDSNGYGSPLDHTNLQYLCRRHHARKSQRESYEST